MPPDVTFDNAALTAKIMSLKRTDSPLAGKSLADFLNERTTVEYVVDDVLVRGYVYSLTGATGSGKTAVAVPLSLYVALGRDFGRHEVQAGPVVYVAGENPADVRMRFAVAVQEMQINPKSFRYEIVDRSFILAERAEELQRIIEDVGAVLVVVDTDQAVSLSGATEENDNTERMIHAKRLREITRAETRPTVLDLCHPRKNATKDDLVPRGGSAFLNEVDGNFCLWREGDSVEMFSDTNKFRGAPVALNFVKQLVESDVVLDTKGRRVPVPFYRLVDDEEAERQRRQDWTEENRLIYEMSLNATGSQSDWAKSCQWFSKDGDPRKDKVNRLLRRLEKARPPLVKQSRAGRWSLTDAGKKEAAKP